MCDETQNLNDTDSETFFGTKFFRDRFRDFFRYQFFRDRFRDFFRYQFFSRPVPRLFSVPNFFDSGSDTIKKLKNSWEREFSGPGCLTLLLCVSEQMALPNQCKFQMEPSKNAGTLERTVVFSCFLVVLIFSQW